MTGSFHNLRLRFRAQFTPAEHGYLYRKGSRGTALPVGAEDADALVAAFDRALKWLAWSGFILGAVVAGAIGFLPARVSPLVLFAPVLAVLFFAFWWAWNAPMRLLAGRAPLAPKLAGGAVRRNNLRTLPWSALVWGAVLAVGLAVRTLFEPDPFGPGNRGYLAWAAVLLLAVGAMAVAKRRAG